MHSNKGELSKSVFEKLNKIELNTLHRYEKNHKQLGNKMIEYQGVYTEYVRKTNDNTSIKARKLADRGFKYEFLTFEAYETLENYKKLLKKKYANK